MTRMELVEGAGRLCAALGVQPHLVVQDAVDGKIRHRESREAVADALLDLGLVQVSGAPAVKGGAK